MHHDTPTTQMPRTFSTTGMAFMLAGISIAAIEWRYAFMLDRLHERGRLVVLICATGFSVWGLKELIAGWWPSLGHRGFAKHRFSVPLTGRLYFLIMIVMFVGSLVGRSNPLLLVFSMMAGPFVLNGWVSFVLLKGLTVRRVVPPRAMAGEPISIEVVLSNPRRSLSAWGMSMRDQVYNAREQLFGEVVVARVPPRSERRAHYRLRLMQRGRYELGPMLINTRFPLGLIERGLTLSQTDSVLVYPRIGRLVGGWDRHFQVATELVPQTSPRSGRLDDQFHKLREYRFGDDPRAIHWRTSARRGELIVREFRESRDQHLLLLLDAYAGPKPSDRLASTLETAVSLAATICVHHLRHSRDAHLRIVMAAKVPAVWDSHHDGVDELLDELAVLAPAAINDVTPLVNELAGQSAKRSRVLVLSTRPKELMQLLENGRDGDAVSAETLEVMPIDEASLSRIVDWPAR